VIRLDAVSASVPGAAAQDEPRQILHDLSIEFRPGESHLILGPNGSGKTTLIRLLAGIHPPASGRVLLDGAPISRDRSAPSLWPRVAVLFEEPDPQFLTDTVEAEIAFGLESLALPLDEIRDRTAEALDSFGLTGFEGRAPHTLSAGEKARTLLAAMMAAKPRVLLLDQSLAHLDPGSRRVLERRLVEDARSGRFALIRTHQDADSPFPGERLHVIEGGQLVDATHMSPRAVLDAARTPFPLAMRVSALLSVHGMWSGHLAMDSASLEAGLAAVASRAGAPREGEDPRKTPAAGQPASERDSNAREAILEFQSVSYSPRDPGGRGPLVADVTLRLGRGEVAALIGASGSGKSTILKLAAGLLAPTSGSIHHAGVGSARDRPTALALEYPERQLFGRTVEEDVTATLWVDGVPAPERRARGREAMAMVGLDHDQFASRVPLTLSEGEKRRVALASLLAEPPRALLLDEPTAGLDPEGRRALATVIRGLSARGHAILMASHDLDFVSAVADRIVVLGRDAQEPGKILGEGPPPAIWHPAYLPGPEFTLVERVLQRAGLSAFEPARGAESLLDVLALNLESRKGGPSHGRRTPDESPNAGDDRPERSGFDALHNPGDHGTSRGSDHRIGGCEDQARSARPGLRG
jgi:energy-coupling factor transport system ATP-binding protein